MLNPFIYAIQPDGTLLWYRHEGQGDGTFNWQGPNEVGTGWNGFSTVFSGGEGVIYAIQEGSRNPRTGQRTGGHLLWYRHTGWHDGSPTWAEGPKTVGTRWNTLATVFSGGEGVIYAIQEGSRNPRTGQRTGGHLLWYRHAGWHDGSFAWAEGPKTVGSRWNGFSTVFSGGDIRPEVELRALLCGVPDPSPGGIQITAYGSPGSRWSRGNLTYNVDPSGSGLASATVNGVLAAAFQQWQAAAPFFSFRQVSGNADIQIRFGGATLDSRFGSPGGVLGVGYYPELGRLFFDAGDMWTIGNLLLRVALHEIGHVLGLSHSTSRVSLMYPYDMGRIILDPETIRAIQSLYGWQPQTRLHDRGSLEGPSLAVAGFSSPRLYMAGRGIPDDDGIYWSSFDGSAWSPQENIPGTGSVHGPALAAGFTRNRPDGMPVNGLFMAWDGGRGDDAIYFAENPDPIFSGWNRQQRIEGVGTNDRPALALFNGRMYMAWRGIPDDLSIYWSSFDGNTWLPQQQIRGRASSYGPALAVLGDRLYMFWTGVQGFSIKSDTQVYYSWIDSRPGAIWQAPRVVVYTDASTEGNVSLPIGTYHRLAAAVRGNAIVLAWTKPGFTGLSFASLENDEWSGPIAVDGVMSLKGPGLATLNDRLYMAWRGFHDDNLYFSWLG